MSLVYTVFNQLPSLGITNRLGLVRFLQSSCLAGLSKLFIGPVFTREAAISPRRTRYYISRSLYAIILFVLMCTAWLVVAGTQVVRDIGDMARFGSILFHLLAPLQLAMILFMAAIQSASAVAQEKDKKTLILLLMTRMSNSELVLGKLSASLLHIFTLLATSLPIFMLISLFGGVSWSQIGWTFAVTAATALASGSLGSIYALWREKTFQALALTAVTLVFWISFWEGLGVADFSLGVIATADLATYFSPISAVLTATGSSVNSAWESGVALYLLFVIAISVGLNWIAIRRVRIWNPSREVMPGQSSQPGQDSIFSTEAETTNPLEGEDQAAPHGVVDKAEEDRSGHVDARLREASRQSRKVWNNPVLWREACTWAYGRKIIFIRIAYVILFLFALFGLHLANQAGALDQLRNEIGTNIPVSARILGPFFLLSLVLVNALAVTSITNERDGRSLDVLLVTDLSPKEFLFGKLGGILYVTKEMVLLPFVLALVLGFYGGITLDRLIYLLLCLAIMNLFAGTLGIHCGMIYSNSRQAIGVSQGTLFFLFLGIMTCMFMMVSFTGRFQQQLMPFLAFIVGGGVGLYVALGHRNPSPAIALASGILPLAMFFAITSFVLDRPISVFIAIAFTFGFTATAMIIPALGEYNIAMGRSRTAEEE